MLRTLIGCEVIRIKVEIRSQERLLGVIVQFKMRACCDVDECGCWLLWSKTCPDRNAAGHRLSRDRLPAGTGPLR